MAVMAAALQSAVVLRPAPLPVRARGRAGPAPCRAAAGGPGHHHDGFDSTVQHLDREHPYPEFEEEKDCCHAAFSKAFAECRPADARIPGLQDFFASVWMRSAQIPSQKYVNTLDHIFDEFDTDKDGHLSAADLAKALQSRSVQLTEAQAQRFIDASDTNHNATVEKEEFGNLVYHMASAELRHHNDELPGIESHHLFNKSVDM